MLIDHLADDRLVVLGRFIDLQHAVVGRLKVVLTGRGHILDRELKMERDILADGIFGFVQLAPQLKPIHIIFIFEIGKG